jgi:hypothetical protein
MNHIGRIWVKTKEWIVQHYSELLKVGKSQAVYDQLARTIEEAWDALDQEYVNNLITGMPIRVAALYLAKGWHTKYKNEDTQTGFWQVTVKSPASILSYSSRNSNKYLLCSSNLYGWVNKLGRGSIAGCTKTFA